MDIETTSRNHKNLLRVAMEIAGKGVGKDGEGHGEMGIDEIEAVGANAQVEESVLEEDIQTFAQIVLEELIKLEENLDFELVDEDLDFAIDAILENLLNEEA
jgi:hypothetical protein